ncbi:MAG TPA: metallophosphoesterase family protein [Kiloniellales bacterium]|nr:metallophosphoesterase family protein [Kiloniellales bacterium]
MNCYGVPKGTQIYAIGDVHGEATLLDLLLEEICKDAQARPAERRLLIYLGDYVDRGPDSRGVLDRLIAPPPDGFERLCLMGNHEEMLLCCLKGTPQVTMRWLLYGGEETCRSYGVDPSQNPEVVAEEVRRAMPQEHKELLHSLKLSHQEGDYFFAHAGIRPGVPLDQQRREDLIWIRKLFSQSQEDHGCVVVHGHSAVPAPENLPNRINVDTGASYGNALTAVALQDEERRFLQISAAGEFISELQSLEIQQLPASVPRSAEPAKRAFRIGWWR